MPIRMEKYVGQSVQIIYLSDGRGFTQRRIAVHSVKDGIVKAYCLELRAPRAFQVNNILAVQPVIQHAV